VGGRRCGWLGVNRQEVVCGFEPVHRGDAANAAVRTVPVVVVQPAAQGQGPLGGVLVGPGVSEFLCSRHYADVASLPSQPTAIRYGAG